MKFDWKEYRKWLEAQYSDAYVTEMYNKSLKHYEAITNPAKAALLKGYTLHVKRKTMESLSALSKFLGMYKTWQET